MPYAHLQAPDAATGPVSSSTNLLGEQCSAAAARQAALLLSVAKRSCLLGSGLVRKVQQLHQGALYALRHFLAG
jgi:hypothetical protein